MPPDFGNDCMLCGKEAPPGHVNVTDNNGKPIGRICSSHTFLEAIMDPREALDIDVVYRPIHPEEPSGTS